jgi:hypothetical protein
MNPEQSHGYQPEAAHQQPPQPEIPEVPVEIPAQPEMPQPELPQTDERIHDPNLAQEMAIAEKPVQDSVARQVAMAETLGMDPSVIERIKAHDQETIDSMSAERREKYQAAEAATDVLAREAVENGVTTLYVDPRETPGAVHDMQKIFNGKYGQENQSDAGLEMTTRQLLESNNGKPKILQIVTVRYNPEQKAA